LVFRLADVFFCGDDWAVSNLKGYPGRKVNIGANTMLDGVRRALERPRPSVLEQQPSRYGVVSIHRFENIYTRRLTSVILPHLRTIAREHHLIFTLHPTTRERLLDLGLLGELESAPHITLHERFGFTDWIHLCNEAEFVITDGGSNQEELSYLGVPTLLFRSETERREGLGRNVVISGLDAERIADFFRNLGSYRMQPILGQAAPSLRIFETLRTMQESA
jgi:UDP-N-acetylglucosamine 2-epimerase (non-hydrolysing)